tara:strand:+ start:2566 stop:2775 length:210 start_codon:yes stop_codon:yes gene_type:complete
MTNQYKVRDILDAVDTLLDSSKEKPLKLINELKKPLKLTNEIKSSKIKLNQIPKDTEKIILQAEKYLKK